MLKEEELESGTISKRGMEIVKGEGCRIWDLNGKEYLDMGASYGVCNVGHRNRFVVDAISAQMNDLLYVSSSYDNPARRELMERLLSVSPPGMRRVFLCNSGTESVEAALKFSLVKTGRKRIVAAKRSFHGRTLGALSLTWNPSHREGFGDSLLPVDFVPYNNIEEMKEAVTEETAAVFLEPIQGEGGVHVPSGGYLQEVRKICTEKGTLMVIDEVQTGLCRTGRMFCVDHHGISPDLMCVGKSLGGGLPIAATIIHENIGSLPKGIHGSTFGGDPLVCAAANGSLRFMVEEKLDMRARDLGDMFMEGLLGIDSPKIREVRGLGLMVGVELKERAGPYLSSLLDRGIAAIPTGATVIRFLPPLVVEKKDIDHTVKTLEEVLNE